VPLFGAGSAEPAHNRSAILEFLVPDVDQEWIRLKDSLETVVTEPTTMPWGNRALMFRDPDGNLVNLFTPVTDHARAKFGIDGRRRAWSPTATETPSKDDRPGRSRGK
jgi:hypothetical protein